MCDHIAQSENMIEKMDFLGPRQDRWRKCDIQMFGCIMHNSNNLYLYNICLDIQRQANKGARAL